MLLFDENGNIALDTEEFYRNVLEIQANEHRFGGNLCAYQVQFELDTEIKENLAKGVQK